MEASPPKLVLAVVRDLIFASRIAAQGRAAGIEVRILRDPAQLQDQSAPLLLVDLNHSGAIEPAANWSQSTGGQVVGFVSHVDTPTIAQARQAGIQKVLARSAFVELLPKLLAEAIAAK